MQEKKKIIASNKNPTKSRPHIIYLDFSDEAKCKKEFISYLNKLSDVNKEVIYEKISTFISKINDDIKHLLFDVLINFIKTSNNNIYIDVLYLFDDIYIETNITKFYLNYLNEKLWLPKDIIVDYKNIFDEENYDTYCEYVKIKKTTLSMLKALIIILNKLNKNNIIKKIVNHIFTDLNTYITNKNSTSTTEHEATTSKISEEQLFYCKQRGLNQEEAVSLIVNGFCKEVLQQLPMEFAVEAQKLVSISLEGSVG